MKKHIIVDDENKIRYVGRRPAACTTPGGKRFSSFEIDSDRDVRVKGTYDPATGNYQPPAANRQDFWRWAVESFVDGRLDTSLRWVKCVGANAKDFMTETDWQALEQAYSDR